MTENQPPSVVTTVVSASQERVCTPDQPLLLKLSQRSGPVGRALCSKLAASIIHSNPFTLESLDPLRRAQLYAISCGVRVLDDKTGEPLPSEELLQRVTDRRLRHQKRRRETPSHRRSMWDSNELKATLRSKDNIAVLEASLACKANISAALSSLIGDETGNAEAATLGGIASPREA